MANFHIYVDESGKSQNPGTNFTALCGYVGHVAEWNDFSSTWMNCRLRWQVPPLHMTRIMNPDKRYDAWKKLKDSFGDNWESWRNAMLDAFASIVEDAGIICVGIVVDADGYRKALINPECRLEQEDANVFSFHTIIMRGIERIDTIDKHSPIAIVVDDDPQNIKAYYDLLNGLRNHPDERFEAVKRRINAISFCRDDDYPGLQVSDMVAFLVRKYARERFTLGTAVAPPSLLYKLTHAGFHAPYFFDGENITELGKNIKRAIESGSNDLTE